MTQTLPFVKMHGAGNDFVMLDGRLPGVAALTAARVAALCDRRKGVGADGLIVLRPAATADGDVEMIYYNADGGVAALCGNGARCAVAYAQSLGLHGGVCRLATGAGILDAEVRPDGTVAVGMPPWRDLELDVQPSRSPWPRHARVDTGVPHLVILVDSVAEVAVQTWGPRLCHDPRLAPAGINVNWVAPVAGGGGYDIRTYERGVEAETLACGTGAAAAAVVLSHLHETTTVVTLHTRGGDRLQIEVDRAATALRLSGPAETSFRGEVTIDA